MRTFSVFLVITFILSGCAKSPNVVVSIPSDTHIYGFWAGTWHGMISSISFIGSFFDNSIKVYAINNNGHFYNFGFIGGLSFIIRMLFYIINNFSNKN